MNVLIVCHPKIIEVENNKIKNHWYGPIICQILNFYNIDINEIVFNTVDIISGGTFNDDCFSENFQNNHRKEYDMVFMPDCGGDFFFSQNNNDITKFKNIIIGITSMLKDNSSILIDKFIYEQFKEATFDVLNELGFQIISIRTTLFERDYNNYIFSIKNENI